MFPFKQTLLASLLALGSAGLAQADGLDAHVSAPQVAQGDSFQLTLSGDTSVLTAPPDLTPLGADFDVLGTAQSRQTRIINGARSDTLQWTVTLSPKSLGNLTIPALTAGAARSDPVQIAVLDAAQMPVVTVPGAPEISVTLAGGNHYVQQEIPLTVRITAGPNVQSAELVLPQSPDFTLTQVGQDKTSRTNTQDGPVTVTERAFMLRPQRDGALTVPPVALKAVLSNPDARSPFGNSAFDRMFANSPFGAGRNDPFAAMFNRGQEVVSRADPITLTVLPDPTGGAGWFLPAKDVQLSAVWEPAAPTFRAGEAVTRKIQLLALGASDVQLPDLVVPQGEGARVYLDGSDARTADTANGTAALREFTYSVVPSYGGDITLPEVTLQWFNTVTETTQTATLAAETITVTGPAKPDAPVAAVPDQGAIVPTATQKTPVWPWGAVAAIALLGAGVTYVRRSKPAKTRNGRDARRRDDLDARRRDALDRASRAARAQDLKALHAATSDWLSCVAAQSKSAPPQVIKASAAFATGWADLERHLFAPETAASDPFSHQQFLAALQAHDRQLRAGQGKTRDRPSLLALYPSPYVRKTA
jgi:hypothetical protein